MVQSRIAEAIESKRRREGGQTNWRRRETMLEKRYLQYFHRGQEQPYEKLSIPSQQSRLVKKGNF